MTKIVFDPPLMLGPGPWVVKAVVMPDGTIVPLVIQSYPRHGA